LRKKQKKKSVIYNDREEHSEDRSRHQQESKCV